MSAKAIDSPFSPGKPVSQDLFVGRAAEINRMMTRVAVAERGRLQVSFLSGERGIGKSSLASFIRAMTEREHAMIALHVFLGSVSSLDQLCKAVFDRFLKESIQTPWYKKLADLFGRHVKKVDLFGLGVEFAASQEELAQLVRDFEPALRNLLDRLKDDKKGLVLILDDIDRLVHNPEFAHWLKSLVDGMSVCLIA